MKRNHITVNFHLTKRCNYKCKYCYAKFKNFSEMNTIDSQQIVLQIAQVGFSKINFAGGEPFLYKGLGLLLSYAKSLKLTTSIISNGSKITSEWLDEYGKFVDIIGISCDSAKDSSLIELGRGKKNPTQSVLKAFELIDTFNENSHYKIYKKLNSVITSINFRENMSDFVLKTGVQRWKIFQMLHIQGENDDCSEKLSITPFEFQSFINRHLHLQNKGVSIVAENNSMMTDSYLMINPSGRFYQNSFGKYTISDPIIQVGIHTALNQISFKYQKFLNRGGLYNTNNKISLKRAI